jgi:hypothetical protein
MTSPRALLAACLAATLLGAPGCMKQIIAGRLASSFEDMERAFNREESPRAAREAAPALLQMLDGIVEMSPRNERLLEQGAMMNATFAFAFIEEEDPAWARILYRKAKDYGLRALAEKDEDLRAALDGPEQPLRARLAALETDHDAIAPLFWTAFAWGGEINVSRGDSRAIADLPKVVAIMERLGDLAPAFYYGGPHLFLGVYYASRGSTLGGDPKKARAHFDAVRRITGGRYPLLDVLYARYYCVALGEKDAGLARAEFVAALERVGKAPLDIDPENRLATAIAKARAAKLLPALDDLILPPLPDDTETGAKSR